MNPPKDLLLSFVQAASAGAAPTGAASAGAASSGAAPPQVAPPQAAPAQAAPAQAAPAQAAFAQAWSKSYSRFVQDFFLLILIFKWKYQFYWLTSAP